MRDKRKYDVKTFISDTDGKRVVLDIYGNGNPRLIGEMKGGLKTGYFEYFYENGNIEAKGDFVLNENIGTWEQYWEDGVTYESIQNYKLFSVNNGWEKIGKWDGEQKWFYRNGQLEDVSYWIEGKVQGVQKAFFDSGVRKCNITFCNGKKNGFAEWFYQETGRTKARGFFKDDMSNGWFCRYDIDGNIYRVEYFENNTLILARTLYEKNGFMKEEMDFYSGDKTKYQKNTYSSKKNTKYKYLEDMTNDIELVLKGSSEDIKVVGRVVDKTWNRLLETELIYGDKTYVTS